VSSACIILLNKFATFGLDPLILSNKQQPAGVMIAEVEQVDGGGGIYVQDNTTGTFQQTRLSDKIGWIRPCVGEVLK
jgi:hypothetical protein